MKKLLTFITALITSQAVYAGLITHTDYTAGNVITAAGQNANENAIINEFNGNIDNTNVKASAGINLSKLSLTDAVTFSSLTVTNLTASTLTVTGIVGTSTNNSALTGNVGEYIVSTAAITTPVTFPSSTHWGDLTSISLTPGDWDVSGQLVFDNSGTATITNARIGISTTSGDSTTGMLSGINNMPWQIGGGIGSLFSIYIPIYRVSINSTTVVYLKQEVTYTSTAGSTSGTISARRVR